MIVIVHNKARNLNKKILILEEYRKLNLTKTKCLSVGVEFLYILIKIMNRLLI